MKKFPILVVLLLILQLSFANLYIPPPALLNELFWDENGDWQLEISYVSQQDYYFIYDSIIISTKNFRYKLLLTESEEYEIGYFIENGYSILNKTIVGDSLDINSEGDSINIKTYSYQNFEQFNEQNLIFGEFENSMIRKPDLGKSIVYFGGLNNFYIQSEKPTLGSVNSAIGTLGTIRGRIYNANDKVIEGDYNFGLTFEFQTSVNGEYVTYMIPGNNKITEIFQQINYAYSDWLDIKPLEFNIDIDDTLDLDIHITDPDFVGVNEMAVKQGFDVYPNPVSNTLTIKSIEFNKYNTIKILLIDVKGQEVASFTKNSDEQITIDLENNVKAGIYVLNIVNHDKLLHSQKIIVNPF